MEDLNYILSQIKSCDTRKPYAFVSYSSQDRETVWADVYRLQQDGYNIWLDEKNLDKTKNSWRDDALNAVRKRHCKIVLFYISASSLCSDPCLHELRETRSRETVTFHRGEVPFLAIEAEAIGDITRFHDKVYQELYDAADATETEEDDREFERKVCIMRDFMEEFFQNSNERVRVRWKKDSARKGDYYEDIERILGEPLRIYGPESMSAPGALPKMAAASLENPVEVSAEKPAEVPADVPAEESAKAPAEKPEEGPAKKTRRGPARKTGSVPATAATEELHTRKTLGTTDIKYSICTFGAGFNIGVGVPVTLVIDGKRYERKMHNLAKGRVDSLKQLYTENGLKLGDVLDARYSPEEHTIYLTKVN